MKTTHLLALCALASTPLLHAEQPSSSWSFPGEGNEFFQKIGIDSAGNSHDAARGSFGRAEGVAGNAVILDGFTTRVTRPADKVAPLGDAFSFEAWIALQEYPWNWAAILNQERDHKEGWFFGIGGDGTVGLHVAKDGKWLECNSKERLPLLKWAHVAGTYDAKTGLKVYLNGKPAGELATTGPITPATGVDLLMGLSHTRTYPIRTERSYSKTFLSPMFLDGLLDEVKIYNKALTDEEVAQAYAAAQPKVAQPLKFRRMPSGPEGPGEFGAVYTRLNYAPEWERQWRVGDSCDILVRFDESPSRIVFWRGMNYGACYVSENGLWAGDQSLEVNSAEKGCFEHMGDKQCQFSTARIVESNDARVVVHARYACTGIDGTFLNTDPDTRWGLWADEYFTIYPDGVTVRYVRAENHNGSGQWQETIMFNQPGDRPEDTVDINAFSLANEKGESHTYSWENGPPIKYSRVPEERWFPSPANANIQMANFRSKWKPYLIFEPGVKIESFGIPPSKDYSNFPCWNHWPIAQLPNDGRKAITSDRPSHFTLSTSKHKIHRDEKGFFALYLYGMTDQPIASLAPLARSWNAAPVAKISGGGIEGGAYDKSQRAYVFKRTDAKADTLEFTLEASEASPIQNPAFVVKNWGKRACTLAIDGKAIPHGKDFRLGHNKTVEGTDLVVWVKLSGDKKTSFKLDAASDEH